MFLLPWFISGKWLPAQQNRNLEYNTGNAQSTMASSFLYAIYKADECPEASHTLGVIINVHGIPFNKEHKKHAASSGTTEDRTLVQAQNFPHCFHLSIRWTILASDA